MSRAPVPLGRFLLFKSLKKGGMARVFLGVDPSRPEELVAIKTLLPKLAKQRLYREMFTSEGKVGVRLEHPYIVRTVEHGEVNETRDVAMGFIVGFDLSSVVRKLRKQGTTMPIPLAVQLARDVSEALAYAHELSDEFARPLDIVNRDVSPGNIMVGFDGRVKLIDFGIAQTTIDVKSQIGSIKGKISYMAPEQVRGLPVDARADLFSLGTVLYEMLTGVQIFHDEGDFATMERVRRAEAPPASSHNAAVDEAMDRLLERAMAREAMDRYPSARELFRDLDTWMTGRGHEVRPEAMADFMRGLFGSQIDDMKADIEEAKEAALGSETVQDVDPTGEHAMPPRLIPEDALDDLEEPAPPPPPEPERSARLWPVLLSLVAVGGAVAWLLLRG